MIVTDTEVLSIATKIQKITGQNVLNKSRLRKTVESRALLNKILYDFKNMTLAEIRNFYRDRGKPMNHATDLPSLRNFEMNRKFNPKLKENFNDMVRDYEPTSKNTKINFIENKIKYLSDKNLNRVHRLVNRLFTQELIEWYTWYDIISIGSQPQTMKRY